MTLTGILWIVYCIWNFAVFLLFRRDKKKAKKGEWRVPEKTLLLCAFFLGGAGAFLGMEVFRHKTKHSAFNLLIPAFAVLGLGVMVYATWRLTV